MGHHKQQPGFKVVVVDAQMLIKCFLFYFQPECNILKNLTREQYKQIRGVMIK